MARGTWWRKDDTKMNYSLNQVRDVQNAENYLVHCLNAGNRFSRITASKFKMWRGEYSMFIQKDSLAIIDFRQGGVYDSAGAIDLLLDILYLEIVSCKNSLIFENKLAKRGDLFLANSKASFAFDGNDVYCLINHENISHSRLSDAIDASLTALAFTAFVVAGGAINVDSSKRLLNMAKAVESLRMIIVGALDNENFLLWRREV